MSPLSQHQWGFTAGRLTTTALLSFTHNCQTALDSGDEVCSVFFDLCKAFDKVPHLPLLQKLADLQVNTCILRWIGSYLLERSQAVVLGGVHSSPLHVISVVPQGSVIGLLLFLVYTDKVTNSVSHSNITMYADDIALWKIIRNPRDYTMLQDDIITICNWVADNHLVLNLTKCCYIVFSRKCLPTMPTADLSVGDTHSLTRAHHHKYLGVTLTSDLSWSLHITNICKKTRKQTGLLYRNFYRFAGPSIMLKLYTSLVRPHTEYASIIWDPHLSKDILALENTQKFALRVCLKNWRADYDLLLDQAHLPRLSSRRKFLRLSIMTPRLLGGLHPILTDSKTLCNSLFYMAELTTSNILFFLHLLRPGTPFTLMLPARTLCCRLNMPSVTSCIRSLCLVFVVGVVCCFVMSFD